MPISTARAKTVPAVAAMTVAPEALVLNAPVARAQVEATVAALVDRTARPAVTVVADLVPVAIAAVDRSGAMTAVTTTGRRAKLHVPRPRS